MKKILLSTCMFLSIAWMIKLNAQCTISQGSISVSKITSISSGSGCDVTFTLEFDLAGNGGNKWSFIHIWNANAYPTVSYANGPGPKKAELNGGITLPKPLLATIAMDYHINFNNIVVQNYYPADNGNVIPYTTNVVATKQSINGVEHFKIENIKVSVADCSDALNLRADVWSSQDDNGKNVACGITGLSFTANDPIVRASNKGCGSTRQVTATFITTEARTINFGLYKDVAPFGSFTAGLDNDASNLVGGLYNATTVFDPVNNEYRSVADYNYTVANGEKFNVWVVATTPGVLNLSTALAENACAPLPVNMTSFTASRSKSNVSVKWTTAAEWDNKGFYVQRNTRGSWDNVAFVFSAAQDGNSSSDLSYSFNDLNNERGVSQYRILQVDLDGRTKASDIRSVRGEAMAAKLLVYPNPSMDGKISVVFEDGGNAARSVIVSDMSGRMIKQYRSVSTNNLSIEGLENGVYSIKVTDLSSAAVSVEKVIVKKR